MVAAEPLSQVRDSARTAAGSSAASWRVRRDAVYVHQVWCAEPVRFRYPNRQARQLRNGFKRA